VRTLILLLGAAVSVPAAAQDLVRALLDSFHAVPWASAATSASPPTSTWPDYDGLACFRHHQQSGEVEWDSDYYALDPVAPECRLLRFHVSTRQLSQEELGKISYAMMDALNSELGPSRDPGRVRAWGAGYWRSIRQWDRDGYRILLYIDEGSWPGAKPPRVAILAEHNDVVRASAAAFAVNISNRGRDLGAETETALRAELGDPTFQMSLEDLLNLASQSTGDRRAALLLAADNVAARLRLTDRLDAPIGSVRTETSANLRFELDHGAGWMYKHDLLEQVWQNYEGSRWGEAAFVLLQEGGWYFGRSCPEDSVFFPKVIEHGERFLNDHPNSRQRLETTFQLAQAYEDWWNAGLAPLEGVYSQMRRAPYEPRMQEMRQKAVAAYDQVIAAEPESVRGRWAALRVPRLKLGLHTDRFRFVDDCD